MELDPFQRLVSYNSVYFWHFFKAAIVAAGICISVRRRSKCSESQTTESHGAESPDMQYPFMQVNTVSDGFKAPLSVVIYGIENYGFW